MLSVRSVTNPAWTGFTQRLRVALWGALIDMTTVKIIRAVTDYMGVHTSNLYDLSERASIILSSCFIGYGWLRQEQYPLLGENTVIGFIIR